MTLAELFLKTRNLLMPKEDAESASFIARELLCRATGLRREQIIADRNAPATPKACEEMDRMTARVMLGEPLAYVLGEWEFYGMKLTVNSNVLIPRDDTCAVTELAIRQTLFLDSNPRVLDLCTGSGCIGLAVANRVKDAKVTLADISREAMQVAKKNIVSQKLSGRVTCVQANALEQPPAFLGKFDLIVSNPPYITTQEMTELPDSVGKFEPHLALHGGQDGLDFYRAIAKNYKAALKPGGYLCFEFGMGQGDAVCRLLEDNGFTILERSRDFNDRERAVLAQFGRKDG
ncbi:MAG: peptide chain release factor N(5)-glutamine methyltransferase [Oscillospiraceae bacterium]|nr:peptide chain release factor N(5)-glutamine methyltransferase [Oscillospiraceae bacterium]